MSNILFFILGVTAAMTMVPLSRHIHKIRTTHLRRQSDLSVRVICPCCRYPTLTVKGGYDICELCNWEDDGQDDQTADEVWGGPNGDYSLITGRANFHKYRSIYAPCDDPDGDRADSPLEYDAKGLLMSVFDQLNECAQYERDSLEEAAIHLEGVLSAETSRRVAQIEEAYRHDT